MAWGCRPDAPPPDSISPSASSTGRPMLPATSVSRPAQRAIAPAISVTVLLPLVPVIAIVFADGATAWRWRAKISISPSTGTPRASARATAGSERGTPGDNAIQSAASSAAASIGPRCIGTSGSAARSSRAPGGSSRVSQASTVAPWRTRNRTQDTPVAPSPTTATRSAACRRPTAPAPIARAAGPAAKAMAAERVAWA